MTVENQDFTMVRGDIHILEFTLVKKDGSPYVLPDPNVVVYWGCGKFHPNKTTFETTPALELSTNGAAVTVDGDKATVTISPDDTLSPLLASGDYYHACRVVDNGDPYTPGEGNMTLKPGLVWS